MLRSECLKCTCIIFVETLDILMWALEALNEDLELLRLQVSWVKTKIQAFNDVLDTALLSVPVCGEDVEVVEKIGLGTST